MSNFKINLERKTRIKLRRNEGYSTWDSINWRKVGKTVTKLRSQIFLAKTRKDEKKVRSLQKKMIGSKANLIFSIRRITSDNRGKKIAGLDKQKYLTPERRLVLYKKLMLENFCEWVPLPVRRIETPRPGEDSRPLGIPNITDRVVQQVIRNALEPEWEAIFEHGSYGFRPGRSPQDAMARIWRVLSSKNRKWVLDADIKGCFNNIAHEPLLKKLEDFPAKELIGRWLKAGYFKGSVFHETTTGTPQGGIISPLLANIALHGMEAALKVKYHKSGYVRTECTFIPVRYADDFVVLCETQQEAFQAKAILAKFLKERGMEFSPEKTKIGSVLEGFDFLSYNFRLYPTNRNSNARSQNWKRAKGELVTLVRPSEKAVKALKTKLSELWRLYIGKSAQLLITKLNPTLRGWANYHKWVNSNETFREIDNYNYQQAIRYARRKHPKKPFKWIKERYFNKVSIIKKRKTGHTSKAQSNWGFSENGFELTLLKGITLENYSSVGYGRNPFSPSDKEYYLERKSKSIIKKDSLMQALFTRQKGLCPKCEENLAATDWEEPLYVHHLVSRKKGGSDSITNLVLLHKGCHYSVHRNESSKEELEIQLQNLLRKKQS